MPNPIDPNTMLDQIRSNTKTNRTAPKPRRQPKPMPDVESPAMEPAGAAVSGGRPVAFWINDEVRSILKEIGRMLYEHDIKPSDSLILWAALKVARNDPRLVETVKELRERDGRKRRNQKPTAQAA